MADFTNSEQMTPLDLLMPKVYITALLTFPTCEPTPILSKELQNGLDKLSIQIPWISGRVFPTSHDSRPSLQICWNASTPPQLIDRGSIDLSYMELAGQNMPAEAFPPSLLPISPGTEHNPMENGPPVFAASFFRFAYAKGLGLYISMHHNAVDATGFSKVVEAFSRNVAGAGMSLDLPARAHRLSHALSSDIDSISSESPPYTLFDSHPEYSPSPPVFPLEFPSCTSKLFSFPLAHINALKQRLAGSMSTPPTTNTLLCALIWSAITRARSKRDESLVKKSSQLAMAVNGRRRIAGLMNAKDPYLGNAVVYSVAQFPCESLSSATHQESTKLLAELCEVIAESQSAGRINSRHIAEIYHLADSVEDYRTIFVGWDLFGSTDITITSWAELNFYEMDFGAKLGRPEYLRLPYLEADGVGLVLPRKKTENEVLEVVIMLRRDDMTTLENGGICDSLQ